MPVNQFGIEETGAGYRPTQKVKRPITPPPKPRDSEHSALPPAYWKDRRKKDET
jgi:hypothetical protein